jgi:hypothetical protein
MTLVRDIHLNSDNNACYGIKTTFIINIIEIMVNKRLLYNDIIN